MQKKGRVMKFEYFCCVPIFQKPGNQAATVNSLRLVSQLRELQNSTADEMLRSKLGNSFRDLIVAKFLVGFGFRQSGRVRYGTHFKTGTRVAVYTPEITEIFREFDTY